ncbi:hypothetical protein Q7P37_000658 [Cladosporium fusiforme]
MTQKQSGRSRRQSDMGIYPSHAFVVFGEVLHRPVVLHRSGQTFKTATCSGVSRCDPGHVNIQRLNRAVSSLAWESNPPCAARSKSGEKVRMADALNLPPRPAPEDMPPNKNAGDGLCIMTWVMLGVSTVFVAGRMMSKTFVLRRIRWDDIFMLLTWATAIVYSACIQLSYHHGLGRHYLYIDITHALDLILWAFIAQMFCILTPMFGRISVNLYTLALLGKTKPYLRYSLWVLLFLQTVFNVAIAFTLLGVCGTNMHVIANPNTTCYKDSPWSHFAQFVGGKAIIPFPFDPSVRPKLTPSPAFNAFTDGALTLAPIFLISSLKTTLRAKIAAASLLCLSSLAMIAALWRTIEVDKIFAADWDFTYNAIPYFYASSFEQSIIMIVGCVPTLGPLFKHTTSNNRRRDASRSKPFKSSTFSSTSSIAKQHSTTSYTPAPNGTGTTLTTTSTRTSSSESAQLQKSLAEALGIHMPGLGNHVTISAGKEHRSASSSSRDSQLPLSDIKTTISTDVKVESAPGTGVYHGAGGGGFEREEDVEKLFSMPKVLGREGK